MRTLRFRVLLASVVTMLAFFTVLQTACKKDDPEPYVDTECINVECNNGECLEGECYCYVGWEGIHCDQKSVNKFIGKWNAKEVITYSNVFANVGDTTVYDFYITLNGESVNTFKLSGLNAKPNDTVLCTMGDPISHQYSENGFYFPLTVSATVPDMFITRGAGYTTQSGGFMDSLGYGHWYGLPGDSSFVVKDTVKVFAQKAP